MTFKPRLLSALAKHELRDVSPTHMSRAELIDLIPPIKAEG